MSTIPHAFLNEFSAIAIYGFGQNQKSTSSSVDEEKQIEGYYSSSTGIDPQTTHYARKKSELLFWDAIHSGSRKEHSKVYSHFFLKKALIEGEGFCAKSYTWYLCNLYCMHQAIEQAQQKLLAVHSNFPFVMQKLFRTENLKKDIASWAKFPPLNDLYGENDPEKFIEAIGRYATDATKAFVEKLSISTNHLEVIGAMYVLYGTLGKGGALVKQNVKEQYGERSKADSHEGTHFFDIGESNLDAFNYEWSVALNAIPTYLKLNGSEKKELENTIINCANFTFQTIFNFIDELEIKKRC